MDCFKGMPERGHASLPLAFSSRTSALFYFYRAALLVGEEARRVLLTDIEMK